MSIFRVNTDRDRAVIVKKFKMDRELIKITEQWNAGCGRFVGMVENEGKEVIKLSRQVYRATDNRIKELSRDKKKNKSDIAALLDLRKSSYDLTMSLKKLGV